MSRIANRLAQHLIDIAVLVVAFGLAFALRFDFALPEQMFKRAVFLLPYVVVFEFLVLTAFGVPRFAWRYVGLREIWRIAQATAVASAAFLVVRFVGAAVVEGTPAAQYAIIPLGVIVVNAGIGFLGIGGVRILRRMLHERHTTERRNAADTRRKILLIGAGRAGVQVARELQRRQDLGLYPVGFIDNDKLKIGTEIHGLRVLGTSEQLAELCKTHGIREVVITIASATGATVRDLVQRADAAGVSAKIIPGISDILDGKVNLSRIRPIAIEDLLGREAVHLETDLVGTMLAGKCVVVTGAGGSIGSELCRQIIRLKPRQLVLVERAEPALFAVMHELNKSDARAEDVEIIPAMCDVTDAERVNALFATYSPSAVFHAAAHKHVPLMEWNPGEAIKNNVFGTRNVADAADRFGVKTMVLVSTDKAVNPTSVMGATKRVAELYVQSMARRSKTSYVAVRFGNVLGSTGSVIPIFQEQIKAGGPVTVTHPDMKRYFMTIPEASQLVMQAGAMGRGGEIFVLDMGEPVRIADLAHDLIKLSGFEPGIDVKVEFCGVRPGEKLFEELGFDAEKMTKTRHKKIFIGKHDPPAWEIVEEGLAGLQRLTEATTREDVDAGLRALVPEMLTPEPTEPTEGDEGSKPEAPSSSSRPTRVSQSSLALPRPA